MSDTTSARAQLPFLHRFWAYQAERFPLLRTVTLLIVFTAASISVSAHLSQRALPGLWTFVVAALVALIVFFQMRASDEVKDHDEDYRYRPERPIPRGLVSLREVVTVALLLVPLAILLAVSLTPWLLALLGLVWLWLGLMTVEFFAPAWLKPRPFIYLVSHMLIMPIIDLFVTATEWLPHDRWAPNGLWLFLALSFFNGCVLEIGRKIWAPQNERDGVETYSQLLGPRRAAALWAGAAAAALGWLIAVGVAVGALLPVAAIGTVAFLVVAVTALRFRANPTPEGQKRIDVLAGLWVLVCYAAAGFAPLLGLEAIT
ncbi:UbiA family prenyltransferase [Dongia deserti]|uniref:UbiA family prenyltransferase n=1 Tax=Dongia deserti TaxID=2268030 RepID=UPI000E65369A|nr:UbiA family prenyltransferase [Dongia deserti]